MLEEVKEFDGKKNLLLQVCCAPCSTYSVEELSHYFNITADFYNPNIATEEEFNKRLEEFKNFIKSFPNHSVTDILSDEYNHDEFLDVVKGYENEPERGSRCSICFKLRLMHAAKIAKEKGFDYFTTTLTISPLKNSQIINRIGQEVEKEVGIKFLPTDFKKREGYKRSIELSNEYNLYRQNFCGCEFSKRDAKE